MQIPHADDAAFGLDLEHEQVAHRAERVPLEPRVVGPRHAQQRRAHGGDGHVGHGRGPSLLRRKLIPGANSGMRSGPYPRMTGSSALPDDESQFVEPSLTLTPSARMVRRQWMRAPSTRAASVRITSMMCSTITMVTPLA